MNSNFIQKLTIAVAIFVITVLIFPSLVLASITDGTIDSTYKYAWGENIGWINFGCNNCNIHITNAGLTGYAWSENYGWINLNPTTAGVKNNGNGNLSGYAWSESLGWISFSGVTINNQGEFLGYATILNDNSKISFNCTNTNSCDQSNFKVKTDWRPQNTQTVSFSTSAPLIGGTSAKTQVFNLIEMGNYQYAYQLIKEFFYLFTQKDWSLINEKLSKTKQKTSLVCPPYLLEYIKYSAKNNPNEVKKLQNFLNEFEGEKLDVNGIYDKESFEAVKRFQKKYEKDILTPLGLAFPTGYVYKSTLKKLNEIYCQRNSTKFQKTTECPYFTKSLKKGMRDEEVKKIQQFLINQGFLKDDFIQSSLFDEITEDAVKKFQIKYSEEILKPWNISFPTGYWYNNTKRQANKLMGCE